MSHHPNKIEDFLRQSKVTLPDQPQDYWPIIRSAGVNRLYAISMSGRTGSTWLATCLDQIPGLGFPQEYFTEEGLPHFWTYDRPQTLGEVIGGICAKYSDNGVFGFKINPGRLFQLGQLVSLRATFAKEHCTWIDMRRLNLLKQAFSFHRARQSGQWHRFKDVGTTQIPPSRKRERASDNDIWREIRSILTQEHHMDRFYANNGIEPLRIFFEELSDSKDQILIRVASAVCGNLPPDLTSQIEERTERISTAEDRQEEMDFVKRNHEKINLALSRRSSLTLAEIQQLI